MKSNCYCWFTTVNYVFLQDTYFNQEQNTSGFLHKNDTERFIRNYYQRGCGNKREE